MGQGPEELCGWGLFERWGKDQREFPFQPALPNASRKAVERTCETAVACLSLARRLRQVPDNGLHCWSCLFSLGPPAKRLSFLHTYFSKTPESRVSFSKVTAFQYSSGVCLSLCISLSLCAFALLLFFLIFSPSDFPSPCLFFFSIPFFLGGGIIESVHKN